MSDIKLLMLDFDGTTANTLPSILYCADKVCTEAGYTLDRELLTKNMGFTTEEAFRVLTGRNDEEFITRISARYREL